MVGKKKKSRVGLKIIAVVVLLICVVVTYNRIQLHLEYKELVKEQQKIELKIAKEEERSVELEEQKKYMQTKKFVEDVAREVLGLVYPDEIILKRSDGN